MKCQVYRHDGRASGPCQREATTEVDGQQFCGRHAAGKRRSQKTEDAWHASYGAARERATAAYEQAAGLSVALGVEVRPYFRPFGDGNYDERMVVPAEFLEDLTKKKDGGD